MLLRAGPAPQLQNPGNARVIYLSSLPLPPPNHTCQNTKLPSSHLYTRVLLPPGALRFLPTAADTKCPASIVRMLSRGPPSRTYPASLYCFSVLQAPDSTSAFKCFLPAVGQHEGATMQMMAAAIHLQHSLLRCKQDPKPHHPVLFKLRLQGPGLV